MSNTQVTKYRQDGVDYICVGDADTGAKEALRIAVASLAAGQTLEGMERIDGCCTWVVRTPTRWITYGDVRGFGDLRASREQADADLERDCDGCREQGGYSDRSVYSVDDEGYLRDDDGYLVWPSSGRGHGAVRI